MKFDLEKRAGLEYLRRFVNKRLLTTALICIGLLLAPHLYGWYHDDFSPQTRGKSSCSDGWYITGYYVPREDELPGDAEEVYVERVGNLSFSQEFLDEIRLEGWGITRFGWALGHYADRWHRSDAGPLDASGKVLKDGAIAIDGSLIPHGAKVRISTLPKPWATKTFRATDTGTAITGQHIDVFTGTGAAAQDEAFRLTLKQ